MTERLLKALPLGVFGSLIVTLVTIDPAPAQEPIPLVRPADTDPVPLPLPPPAPPAQGEGIEVLAKGPVHEAFAGTAEAPTAPPVVAKQPPEPIEELPPDQKPEGDNVQWIPGYWSWDEESARFIWVSGFWRQPPPGRVWVPGTWREVKNGWQYVPGFWQEVARPQPQQPLQPQTQPEIEYLPPPPQTLEIGPTVAAPNGTSVYVPGSWVWRHKFVWRPGVWVEYRRDWVWVSARYHWTPAGHVFCDGYWDYPLATRGVLFAPVAFAQPVYARPAFVYTPVYVVSEPCMTGALFVRRGYGNYYFGDYFSAGYVDRGYSAWCGVVTRNGFSIGFGTGRTWGYDPLWSYYSVAYRNTPRWNAGVNDLYVGRYSGRVDRPPTTLVQQNTVINNITRTNVTNVTNNITVVNGATTVNNHNVSNVAMVAPLKVAPDLQRTKFVPVTAENRRVEATAAKQIRDVGAQRTRLETAVVNKPQPLVATGAPQPAVQPRTIKLDVPKAAAQRAYTVMEDKAPPPNPLRAAVVPNSGAKVDPPKVDPKPPAPAPVVQPPKVNPPAPVVQPKPPAPIVQPPKVDPPKVNPPVTPLPKVDPKPPAPVVPPVVQPPKVNPPVAPKVDPPKPPAPVVQPPALVPPKLPAPTPPAPVVQPKPPAPVVQPPKVNPPVAPKVDPPKPPAPPPPAPVVQPKPPAPVPQPPKAPVAPKVNPPAPPVQPKPPAPVVQPPKPPAPTPPAPVVQPKPPAPVPQPPRPPVAPKVNPPAPPKPVAVAPPAPVVQPRPAAVVQPKPPAPVAQPAKPPAAPPRPAPVGKPAKKPNGK